MDTYRDMYRGTYRDMYRGTVQWYVPEKLISWAVLEISKIWQNGTVRAALLY